MRRKSKKKQQDEQKRAMTENRVESIINTLGVMSFLALNQDLELPSDDRLKAIAFEVDTLAEKLGLDDDRIVDYLRKIDYVGSPFSIELQSAIQSLGNSND